MIEIYAFMVVSFTVSDVLSHSGVAYGMTTFRQH